MKFENWIKANENVLQELFAEYINETNDLLITFREFCRYRFQSKNEFSTKLSNKMEYTKESVSKMSNEERLLEFLKLYGIEVVDIEYSNNSLSNWENRVIASATDLIAVLWGKGSMSRVAAIQVLLLGYLSDIIEYKKTMAITVFADTTETKTEKK